VPELPEVETYVRSLALQLAGKRIVDARVFWPRIVAAPEPSLLVELIRGQRFDSFRRRGKYMLFGLDSGETLIIHLRMTGELRLQPPTVEPDKHTHLMLELDSGEWLHYRDQRKFGRIWLVTDPETVLAKLGPEPLSNAFTPTALAHALNRRTATIKSLLLDQSIVAGVGNIYADEALFTAGIDPQRQGGTLDEEEVTRLVGAIRTVLQWGIDLRGSSLGQGPQNYMPPDGVPGAAQESHQVFRRTGFPCPQCGTPIERIVLAGRSTHFCPHCQC
jgi:formamidopyrimidine-DNA glycosylase